MRAFDLNVVVCKGVFSPKHFHGWRIFTKNFPKFKRKEILEIGCGHGITSVYLAKNGAKKVMAVDVNSKAIKNTKINARMNGIKNIIVKKSDIFSSIEKNEKFDIIYWNLPFIYVPEKYKHKSMLEKSLFDPGYRSIRRFFKGGKKFLKKNGKILIGFGDFGDIKRLKGLANKNGYSIKLIFEERSIEGNPVKFQLYELK